MTLDVYYGNITEQDAQRLGGAAGSVDDVPHEAGTAEPWISRLVHSFIIASGARTVIECGSYKGGTSVWIIDALDKLGGGTLHLCEIDAERMNQTLERVGPSLVKGKVVNCLTHLGDVLDYLRRTENRFDLAWVDDCHEKAHVEQELRLLYPKMNPGGIILGHDVWGSCDLQEVFAKFGGYSLNLPRLGAAGGMGIIQLPDPSRQASFNIAGGQAVPLIATPGPPIGNHLLPQAGTITQAPYPTSR